MKRNKFSDIRRQSNPRGSLKEKDIIYQTQSEVKDSNRHKRESPRI